MVCRGGLELLMKNTKEHKVKIDEGPRHVGQSGVTIKRVISWIKVGSLNPSMIFPIELFAELASFSCFKTSCTCRATPAGLAPCLC